MHKITFVITLYACTCQGSREQSSEKAEIDQSKEQASPVKALALLLAAAGPGTQAFSPGLASKLGGSGIAQGTHGKAQAPTAHTQLDKVNGNELNKILGQGGRGTFVGLNAAREGFTVKEVDEQDAATIAAAAKDTFKDTVKILEASAILSPTGEQPATDMPEGSIVGSSQALAGLQTFFQNNPEGVVALPLSAFTGADGGAWKDQSTFTPSASHVNRDPRAGPRSKVVMSATAKVLPEENFVPDERRRTLMNLILLGGTALPLGSMALGYIYFFFPPAAAGGGGGLTALDAEGTEVTFTSWLKSHPAGDHNLVQGLKGDAHYLIVTADSTIEPFALNAVCTHLGCVVPWSAANNKFMCPCHGSQYDFQGKVVRGPAPLSLALAHVNNVDDKVSLTPWTEEDFRGGKNWWT